MLRYEVVDQVARITMDHPPVNALGIPFLEDFEVRLSTASNIPGDFSSLLGSVVNTPATYTKYSYDLAPYVGQPVYLAIRYTSGDEWRLLVDDVSVIPEPSTALLLVTGLAGLALRRRLSA